MRSISATYAARRSTGAGDLTNGPRHPESSSDSPNTFLAPTAFSSLTESSPTNAVFANPPMDATVLASSRSCRSACSSAEPSLWGMSPGDLIVRFSKACPKISACAKSKALARLASVEKTWSKAERAALATASSGSCWANHQEGASLLRCLPRPFPAPPATIPMAFAAATRTAVELSRCSLR